MSGAASPGPPDGARRRAARAAARHALLVLLLAVAAACLLRGLARSGRLPAGAWPSGAFGLGAAAAGAVGFFVAGAATAGRGLPALFAAITLGFLGRLVIYGATLVTVARWSGLDLGWAAGSLVGSSAVLLILETRFAIAGLGARVRAGAGGGPCRGGAGEGPCAGDAPGGVGRCGDGGTGGG